ncbi:MAG: DUF1801 domain-containing protein [Pseudomonadota bacterium]
MDETLKAAMIAQVADIARTTGFDLGQKYGGTVFLRGGALCGGVYGYSDYISVEFSNGASFDDPSGVLEGKGKSRRHVKLHQPSDIDTKSVEVFLTQA